VARTLPFGLIPLKIFAGQAATKKKEENPVVAQQYGKLYKNLPRPTDKRSG